MNVGELRHAKYIDNSAESTALYMCNLVTGLVVRNIVRLKCHPPGNKMSPERATSCHSATFCRPSPPTKCRRIFCRQCGRAITVTLRVDGAWHGGGSGVGGFVEYGPVTGG